MKELFSNIAVLQGIVGAVIAVLLGYCGICIVEFFMELSKQVKSINEDIKKLKDKISEFKYK